MQKKLTGRLPISINDQAKQSGGNGRLNPDWVECLMGFPIGWTDINCDSPVPWPGWPAGPFEAQYGYEPPRTAARVPNAGKRLKCLGNAVVPQQAYPVFKAIAEAERRG